MAINIKQILANSLIELCNSKSIKKITVQNILDNCSIGRQTFYNHFRDKYELINWIYRTQTEEIIATYDDGETLYEFIKKIYSLFLEHKQFYSNISKLSGKNSFVDFICEYTKSFYLTSIINRYGKDEITDSLLYSIEFAIHGAINMHLKWIREGMKKSPEEMAKGVTENIPLNLRKYFN